MKKNTFILNTLLAAVLTVALVTCILVRTFMPWVILPRLDIPAIAGLSLLTLLLDHYLAKGAKRCYICAAVFSAISFAVLPFAAGFASGWDVLKLGLIGGAVFTVLTWLFTSVQVRLSSGPAAKLAPVISAFGLFLAFQAFANILL